MHQETYRSGREKTSFVDSSHCSSVPHHLRKAGVQSQDDGPHGWPSRLKTQEQARDSRGGGASICSGCLLWRGGPLVPAQVAPVVHEPLPQRRH